MSQSPPDAVLVQRAREGARTAFDTLVDRYWQAALAMARKRTRHLGDAEDAAQEAFVLAWRKLTQLRDPERFAGWLFTIVARACVECARRKPRRPIAVEDIEASMDGEEEAGFQLSDDSALSHEIQVAIDALPDHYRPVVLLRYGQGMAVKDISRSLDVPVGTVVSQIFRANRILRTRLAHLVGES